MILDKICMPALLYIGFTLTHIIIDIFKKLYNSALLKFILMIIFTTMLDLLCKSGLTVLSWIIVFLPFILLTAITALLLFSLGLSPDKGFLKLTIDGDSDNDNGADNGADNGKDTDNIEDNHVEFVDDELTSNVEVENMFNM